MNRWILWLFVLLILVWSVNALEVGLISPEPNAPLNSLTQTFKCTSSENGNLTFKTRAGSSYPWMYGQTKSVIAWNHEIFSYIYQQPGSYEWTCNVTSITGQVAEASSRTLTINILNNPPIYPKTTGNYISNQTWSKGTSKINAFDLDTYFYDLDYSDNLVYTASNIDNPNIEVSIDSSTHEVSFSQPSNYVGIEYVVFTASDGKDQTNSHSIKLTVIESGSQPTLTCSGATITWNKDNTKSVNLNDYCDPDATSYSIVEYPTNIGVSLSSSSVTFSPNSSWTGTQTAKFNAVKDSLNSNFTFTLTVQEPSSSNDEEEETTTSNQDEFAEEAGDFTIKSHSPTSGKVSIKVGESKKFEITPSGDAEVKWYLEDKEVYEGNSYTFKSDKDGLYEITAVIGSNPDLRNNDDFYLWTVTVGELANLCGNNKTDSNENCENCAKDVKCASNEECINKTCVKTSKSFFSSLSGYAVKSKDFVVKKWKYSSIIGGVIVVLVIVGLLYAGKRRKKDALCEFGKESFFSRIGKIFSKKKNYVMKKTEEKPQVEKQVEFYVDKPNFSNDEKT